MKNFLCAFLEIIFVSLYSEFNSSCAKKKLLLYYNYNITTIIQTSYVYNKQKLS